MVKCKVSSYLNGEPLIAFADEKGMLTVSTEQAAKAPFFVYGYVRKEKLFLK